MSGAVKRQDKADIIAEQLQTLPCHPHSTRPQQSVRIVGRRPHECPITDLKVNEVTPALFAKASSAEAMAALKWTPFSPTFARLDWLQPKPRTSSGFLTARRTAQWRSPCFL